MINKLLTACRKGKESSGGGQLWRTLPKAWGDLHHSYALATSQAAERYLQKPHWIVPHSFCFLDTLSFSGQVSTTILSSSSQSAITKLVRRGDKPLAQQKAAPAHLEASGMGCGGRSDGWICLCFAVWKDTLPAPSWGPYSEFIEVLWIRLDSCCWRFIFFLYSSNCQKSQAYVVQPLLWDKMSMSHWKEDIKVRLHSLQLAPSPSVSAQSSSCSFLLFC